jgi:D-alanyl-D-alanine carboxypeptidase
MKKYRNYTIASLFSFIMGFSLMYGSVSIITNPPQVAIAYNKKLDFLSQNHQITTNLENLKEQNEILEKKIENSYDNKIINQDNKNTLTLESPQDNSQKEEFDLVEKNLDYVNNNINEKEILIDLEKMKLLAYEKGNLVHDIDIVSKGRPNSYFETPVGEYEIGIKNIKHFSSIGKVYLPYSIQFFGNFFIHGIPEYPNGKKVNSEYSGGCIRLNDQDAKTIYYFADQNTKIKILDYPKTNEIIKTKKSPSSNAIAYAIMDIKTGKIIAEQNSNKVLPIASITKLMTAIISLETINQEHFLTLTLDSYNEYGDSGKLVPLAKYKIKDLLYPMLLTSSNDAAKALANHYGYDSL